MSQALVIVESPAKAKTISKFLGSDFAVEASFGHVRDLPTNKMGVSVSEDYEPVYIVPKDKTKVINHLKTLSKKAKRVILATDEDREGEAIAWHLAEAIGLDAKKTERIVFHEITKPAIEDALKHPRSLDIARVDARQGRRILDRLVGYTLSPFLWKKIRKGLSAGRVQSVAVRLIVEREEEIQKFVPKEYWHITAKLSKQSDAQVFEAKLSKKQGEKIEVGTEEEAKAVLAAIASEQFTVAKVTKKEVVRNPYPPFITSTLQQEAARKLGFSASKTMFIAQNLYEGVELGSEGSVGLITYMRTDSCNLAQTAVDEIRGFIKQTLGDDYLPKKALVYKTKAKGAQEAHEAIRPTSILRTPKAVSQYLNKAQLDLYELIWKRTMACQTAQAILDSVSVSIAIGEYEFSASGSTVKFDGFLKIYEEGKDNTEEEGDKKDDQIRLPVLEKGENLTNHAITPTQHFTKPPARFSEATLVKALEENGIGRPSTYAPILSNIVDRGYVELQQRKFYPTDIGKTVNGLLVQHFPDIVDIGFTASLEEKLDDVAEGTVKYKKVLDDFYKPFFKLIQTKEKEVKKSDFQEETDLVCEKCGKPMIVRFGRFGKFLACSGFPECKNTKQLEKTEAEKPQPIGLTCKKCGVGDIVERRTRKGKIFYGCSRFPACDYASWLKPVAEECPTCGQWKVENREGTLLCQNCDKDQTAPTKEKKTYTRKTKK